MKFKTILLVFCAFYCVELYSADGKSISFGGYDVTFNINTHSLYVEQKGKGEKAVCNISNLDEGDYKNGNGIIHLSTDEKTILFYSSGRYLLTSDVTNCNSGATLRTIPGVNMLQDINFSSQIYLDLALEDKDSWSARVSKIGSSANLIKAPGFFNEKNKNSEEGFPLYGMLYVGRISINGGYVAPNGLDCTEASFPGVWDLKENKKVVFSSDTNSEDEIADKCQKLFNGEATLKDLGGKLILPDK